MMPKPPVEPMVQALEALIDRSPHCDWLTQLESRRRAERIIEGLASVGLAIQPVRGTRSSRHEGFRPARDGIEYDSSEQ